MNQQEIVLKHLKEGKILNKEIALNDLGILHLGTKIGILRDEGFNIQSEIREIEQGKKRAFYWLEEGRY